MRLLSLDQSSMITGWAVFEDDRYLLHGMIDLHRLKDAATRFERMCDSIRQILEEQKPDRVAIEDVMLMRSPQTTKLLARLQGVIIGYCQMAGIPCTVLLPSAWRKVLGFEQGRTARADLKTQAIQLVESYYNIFVQSDEADAICIAMAYLKSGGAINE